MTSYVVYPDCGYKLFKLGDGSNAEIYCPKCKLKLQIEIKNGKIHVCVRHLLAVLIPDKFFTAVLKLLTTKKVLNNYMESTNGSYTLTKLTTFLLKSEYI